MISNCEGTKSIGKDKEANSTKTYVEFSDAPSLTKVLEEAQSKGKIVFLEIYTTSSTPHKVMDRNIYSDASVRDYLSENMVSYKVDAEKENGLDLVIIYNVEDFPTLIFLDDRGHELVRNNGALGVTSFLELAKQAKAKQ